LCAETSVKKAGRLTKVSQPARAPDSLDIHVQSGLARHVVGAGQIVVDHVIHAHNVQAPGRHVGCNQNATSAGLERIQSLLAKLLAPIAFFEDKRLITSIYLTKTFKFTPKTVIYTKPTWKNQWFIILEEFFTKSRSLTFENLVE